MREEREELEGAVVAVLLQVALESRCRSSINAANMQHSTSDPQVASLIDPRTPVKGLVRTRVCTALATVTVCKDLSKFIS